MPKNQYDVFVCINHPEEKLINPKYYAMTELPIKQPNQLASRDIIYIQSISCPRCDYTEFIRVGEINIPAELKSSN